MSRPTQSSSLGQSESPSARVGSTIHLGKGSAAIVIQADGRILVSRSGDNLPSKQIAYIKMLIDDGLLDIEL